MEQDFKRATVFGCACVIVSRFTVQEIDDYGRYLPEALELKGENGDVVFRMELDSDGQPGSIGSDRIVYSRTRVPDGKATVTVVLDPGAEDKAELVRRNIGLALIRLEKLENRMLEKAEQLRETMQQAGEILCQIG